MSRIIIWTQSTMASTVAARQIIRDHPGEIIAIVVASQLRGDSWVEQARLALKMLRRSSLSFAIYKFVESTGYSILLSIHKILRTKRYMAGTATGIPELARRAGIRVIKTGNLSDQVFLNTISSMKPDFIFCMVGQILKRNVFETLGKRLLNAHGSYLPEYRGAAQYFWYLMDGHARFGVSLHYMNAGLDTGDIIFQHYHDFNRPISAYAIHHRLGIAFGTIFNRLLVHLASGAPIRTTKQDDSRATHTRMPTSDDMRRFRAAGYRLFTVADFFSST